MVTELGSGVGTAASGGGTPATTALHRAGIGFTLHTYRHDPRATSLGGEAAAALGADPARVFKTLLALLEPGSAKPSQLVVGVVTVSGHLDLKALARALGGSRASMAPRAQAERTTGYVAGGISPVGQRHTHPTVVDSSALEFESVFVSAGRRGLELELSPADLIAATAAVVAPIGRA